MQLKMSREIFLVNCTIHLERNLKLRAKKEEDKISKMLIECSKMRVPLALEIVGMDCISVGLWNMWEKRKKRGSSKLSKFVTHSST